MAKKKAKKDDDAVPEEEKESPVEAPAEPAKTPDEPVPEAPAPEIPAPAAEEPVMEDESEEEQSSSKEDMETVTGTNILLFGRWPMDINPRDKGLKRYINVRDIGVPHSCGINSKKRFWKHKQSIVERLATRMMTPGTIRARIKGKRTACRSGKKQKALNIIRRAFELVHLKTNENPVQILIQAIENSSLREDTTRISMGGISYQSSVDVAPARRVDVAIHYLALGASRRSHNSPITIEECLADEILAAARGESSSFAVSRKEEKERIALSAR